MSTSGGSLARTLGLSDAVVIGLGSMIGAGVFVAFVPAASAAGTGLLIGLAIAAVVAFCNATSSAQLAAQYPQSGGTYLYGRARLGEWPGFLAGWSFLIGKTASCAAMATTFAYYAAPESWTKPVAVLAIIVIATINYLGVTRTAALTKVVVATVLSILTVVVVIGLTSPDRQSLPIMDNVTPHGWYGVLQSAGLLFFAFAGYARIATMGEEVTDPKKTIPRAIVIALTGALIVYVVIAVTLLVVLGPGDLGSSTAPLVDVVTGAGQDWASPLVRLGAAAASLGALLALMTGIGRTTLAMARNHDLPHFLSAIHPKFAVPHRAEISLALIVCLLVVSIDLRAAIGFSSFGVLLYYLVANISAFTQSADNRRYPRAAQLLGVTGCCVLIFTLPASSIAAGCAVLAVGVAYRVVTSVLRSRTAP